MSNMMKILKLWLAAMGLSSWACSSQAAELSLATTPLFLGSNVAPNVFFMLDDSGSMDWETLTFDYNYYLSYWEDNNEDPILSGVWEMVTDLTVTTTTETVCTGGRRRGGRRRGGGGGGTCTTETTTTTNGGNGFDVLYLYDEPDNLNYSNTTAEDEDQIYLRDWRGRSVDFNLLYYNPQTNYTPWDSSLSNASFAAARSNPQSGQDGYNEFRDLDGEAFEVWIDDHGFTGTVPDGPDTATDGANDVVDLWDSHTQYTFDGASIDWVTYNTASATVMVTLPECDLDDALDAITYEDCFGTTLTSGSYSGATTLPWGRTVAEEQQNYANWYSYYRKRSYVAKAAIARVIKSTEDFRYGLSLLNDYDTNNGSNKVFVSVPSGNSTTFPAHNDSLLQEMFDYEWEGQGTPLRRGLELVGKYYDDVLPGKTDPIISQCQQNFSILLTDGFWNGSSPDSAIGDANGDGYNRTVADVAKYYYDRDLSPLPNDVPTSVIDSNNEQHMVTFTVAFGLRGGLEDTDDDGFPNPVLDDDDDWGDVYSADEGIELDAKIDDLWHAAINSKGWYIQAQDPDELVDALSDALSDITDRVGSSASVATNSGSLNAGSHLFQARFDSGGWSGQLIAFAINADATLNPVPSWEASEVLETQDYNTGRTIVTYKPSTGAGVPFRFPNAYVLPGTTKLASTQIQDLLDNAPFPSSTVIPSQISANQSYGEDLVDFLRGDRSNEATVPRSFRERNTVLGDIVDSDPKFVGVPRFRYPDDNAFAPKDYSDFQAAYSGRTKMVYVGANDGMLHGFEETNGTELLAYVPNVVFDKLSDLANPLYQHDFYVNEAPIVVDAYLPSVVDPSDNSAGSWNSVLAGSLGYGGQGIYALNVTDPSNFSEANADDIVLWEFDEFDDADLGYTFSEVQIAKMQNGQWAAVFSNGYNNTFADGNASTTGHASLFIVNLDTGALIKKIDTESGTVATPNGLSTPSLIDIDGDYDVDIIYAGDLRGNVWKFDVSSGNTANWEVAYEVSGNPVPLFTTINNQPITSPIQVTLHPERRDGYMLYFGSGKYLEFGDNSASGQDTQAFYGIWDKDLSTLTPFDENDLLQQIILDQFERNFDTDDDMVDDVFNTVRDSTNYQINYDSHMGWYINLLPAKINGVTNTSNQGEKQVSRSVVRDGRVIFTTVLPSAGACDFGGSSFTMSLSFVNGGLLSFPAFDLNNDGEFDSTDTYVSGVRSDVGIVPTVSILTDDDRDIAFGSGSSGAVQVMELNVGDSALGRQSWRELQ